MGAGIKPNCNTLGTLIDAFGRRGHIKPALYLLEVMVEDLKMQPKEWHVTALRRVMVKRQLQHPLIPPVSETPLSKVAWYGCLNHLWGDDVVH